MLVLSRKQNQSLKFPNLGISIEILRMEGKTVRVGVDAPSDVRILRGELSDHTTRAQDRRTAGQQRHDVRNHLNTANLALHLVQKQLDAGRVTDAEQSLHTALESLSKLDRMATSAGHDRLQGSTAKTYRTLVVEDNHNERELMVGYLRLCGYEVDAVEDGVAALEYLSTNSRPDAVLLDMQMPRMDGPKTIAAIRCDPNYRGMKVFAVSGADRASLGIPVGDRGVDRWFAKPLKPEEFADRLAAELGAQSGSA